MMIKETFSHPFTLTEFWKMPDTVSAMNIAINQLRKEGIPEKSLVYAAALMIGQAMTESYLNPNAWHDGFQGFGIYGAKNERKDDMFTWLDHNKFEHNSLEGQIRYMIHEVMTEKQYVPSQRSLYLASPDSLEAGSLVITSNFERPKVNNWQTRLRFTQEALDKYQGRITTNV